MTHAMHQVLVIEDDAGIRNVLRVLLQAENYRVIEAATAVRGEIEARTHKPDLLLVDLGLPDGDGIELIGKVRKWSSTPVVVLSARAMEEQKIAALDAGADDYVTKPFSTPELLARVRAALRRAVRRTESTQLLRLGTTEVDLVRRTACGDAGPIHLTPLEYRVLESLARQTGMIVMQSQLLRDVWGPDRLDSARSLRVCMRNLRQKLEVDPSRPRHLITEPGLGYRLLSDETQVS
jgi:two-component system KDP operon response regulator KdpE